ncbi:MAG: hypothetical protein WCI51_16290 [Lentisphaerota bacterium]
MIFNKINNSSKPAGCAKARQSGQAIVEMCAGIIGIMAVFLGLIFICGLSISNVQTLFAAKINAETSSRNATKPLGGSGWQDIDSWNYGNDAIPFTADDRAVLLDTSTDNVYYLDLLNNPNYSESNAPYGDHKSNKYIFSSVNYQRIPPVVKSNFTDPKNPLNLYAGAANLTEGLGNQNDKIYTLKSNKNNSENQVGGLSATFNDLFGTHIQDINLNDMNKVYMPRINSDE